MIPRRASVWLNQMISKPHVTQIYGLRQTGKTTLMNAFREKFPKALFFPLYDLVLLRRYENHPERWILELEDHLSRRGEPPLHVFVDEIQKIPAFFQGIQGLYEKYKGKIKFWIWGSSARPLKRERAETLAGRSLSKILWPLSQSEILEQESALPFFFDPKRLRSNIRLEEPRTYSIFLKRALSQSLLPEPYLMDKEEDSEAWLESYVATYLENEIRRENLVDDIGTFENFIRLAASEDTEILYDVSKAKALGISPKTVKNYYAILSDTFVCRFLPAYSGSVRVQISKSPKAYFSDAGLARFLSGERGFPQIVSGRFGKFFEGFVINEIAKNIEYQGLPWKLSYFRTKDGHEVDLVISQGQEKIAVEVKSTSRIHSDDMKEVKRLMELDPRIKHALLITRQSAPFELDKKIYNVPAWSL